MSRRATEGSPSAPLKFSACLPKSDSILSAIRHRGDVSTVPEEVNTALRQGITAIPPPKAFSTMSPHKELGPLTFDPIRLSSFFTVFLETQYCLFYFFFILTITIPPYICSVVTTHSQHIDKLLAQYRLRRKTEVRVFFWTRRPVGAALRRIDWNGV